MTDIENNKTARTAPLDENGERIRHIWVVLLKGEPHSLWSSKARAQAAIEASKPRAERPHMGMVRMTTNGGAGTQTYPE